MNIVLIELKTPGGHVYNYVRLPRLALSLLGELLRRRGHKVRIYADTLAPVNWKDVKDADLVGFSAVTSTAPSSYKMAERVRKLGIKTVIGGAHATFMTDEALQYCDFVVRKEGQVTILELVDALEKGTGFEHIKGLSYRGPDGGAIHNEDRPPCTQKEYEALPHPNLKLIVGYENMQPIPIMTQWGCPHRCKFCSVWGMFGGKVRYRPIEAVLDDLEQYSSQTKIFFYDDNFVMDRKRTKKLLRGMIDRDLTPTWSAQMRAEAVLNGKKRDDELLQLMKDSGCNVVYCGFESANEATLQAYNKRQNVEEVRKSVRAFHDYGIHVHGMFVVGGDTDNVHTLQQTADFALQNNIDSVQLLIFTPWPGSELSQQMMEQGRLITPDWSLYDGQYCVFQPKQMTPYELQMGTYRAYARFYSIKKTLGMFIHNLPYLLDLLIRERRLRQKLPRMVASLLRPRQKNIWGIMHETLPYDIQRKLMKIIGPPVFRLYAQKQLQELIRKGHEHQLFLRSLTPQPASSC